MTDFFLYNKIAELNNMMKPERLFFEKGTGAYGKFQLYMPLSDYTNAELFNNTELPYDVFVRFSRAMGQRGSAETLRDIRSMEVKFFLDTGEYDLISLSIPVFFSDIPEKLIELMELLKSDEMIYNDKNKLWEFVANTPESIRALLWLYSSRGTIKSYRYMESFSVFYYIWENKHRKKFYIKYRWVPFEKVQSITAHEAEFLAGYAPNTVSIDLHNAIAEKNNPEYELLVQILSEEQFSRNLNYKSKVLTWSESLVPYIKIGKLTLNRLPTNHQEEVELRYLSPSNLIKGIELPEDKLLELICFAYDESFRHRRR